MGCIIKVHDDRSVWGAGPKLVLQDGGEVGVLLLTDQMAEPDVE